jgi:hypothetical protein
MKKTFRLASVLGLVLAGCGGEGGGTDVVNIGVNGVTGQLDVHGTQVTFSAVARDGGFYDVTVELNGLKLTALVDPEQHVSELDGFAAGGHETQMTADDRKVLVQVVRALEKQISRAHSKEGDVLIRLVNLWSEHPDSLVLQRRVLGTQSHSNDYCATFDTWQYATHDGPPWWLGGCGYNDWDANSTSIPYIGYRWDSSNTYYWVNGSWTTNTQDHQPYVYEAGDCFGNCGAGCPDGAQTLTQNCANHDQCVRNGHSIIAISCDDEFAAASADYIFANICPGT